MYNLREVNPKMEGLQTNTALGKRYVVVDRNIQPKEFQKLTEYCKERGESGCSMLENEDIFGFVSYENGQYMALWKSCDYYIITDSGATYQKVKPHN